jgi:hypothetical protein
VLYEDASPLLMRLIEDLAPRVHPFFASHGGGKTITFSGVTEDSDRTRVLARVADSTAPYDCAGLGWYVVEMKWGQWQVVRVEPTYFK